MTACPATCAASAFADSCLLTIFGVCGTRIIWIYTVFPASQTFETIMQVYPISLAINMVLIFCALIITRPSKRYDHVVLDS